MRALFVKRGQLLLFVFFILMTIPTSSSAMSAMRFYLLASKYPEINAFAATCQSAHETGWWKSKLWVTAQNGAGIKAEKEWRDRGFPSVQHSSPELVGNQLVRRVSYFRVYTAPDDFMMDYRNKIIRDYPLSVYHRDIIWGYFSGLQKGRKGAWATNNQYYQHLVTKAFQLAPTLLGFEWREILLEDYHEANRRRILTPHQSEIIRTQLLASGVGSRIYPK